MTTTTKGKSQKHHFLNNKEFYADMVAWKKSGIEKMPDNVARKIMLVCDQLATSSRFNGYTWLEEMKSDAILICVKFAKNFDPERFDNPFAYFTRLCWNAFIRRITQENDRLAAMYEYRDQHAEIYDFDSETTDTDYGYIEDNARAANRTYSKSRKKKAKKERLSPLDGFM